MYFNVALMGHEARVVVNVSLLRTSSGQVMKQCSFLIDDLTDSVKL